MEYMTVREAAKKWEVSVRLIQRLCAEGRIDGASKSGNAWVIPAGTVKPQDPRRKKEGETAYGNPVFPNLMPLMNTAFVPGKCLEYIHGMKMDRKRILQLQNITISAGIPMKLRRRQRCT